MSTDVVAVVGIIVVGYSQLVKVPTRPQSLRERCRTETKTSSGSGELISSPVLVTIKLNELDRDESATSVICTSTIADVPAPISTSRY